MSDYVFLFDLDSTLTKEEILPALAKEIHMEERMRQATENTMRGEYPFRQSFIERVNLLKELPVDTARNKTAQIQLHEKLAGFIKEYHERCYIVTGNLDIWIEPLIVRLGMENRCFSSQAAAEENRLKYIINVLDKSAVLDRLEKPFVAIGDGDNDAEMIRRAQIGIGFGAVRPIASSVLSCATHAFYDEAKLYEFLNRLL